MHWARMGDDPPRDEGRSERDLKLVARRPFDVPEIRALQGNEVKAVGGLFARRDGRTPHEYATQHAAEPSFRTLLRRHKFRSTDLLLHLLVDGRGLGGAAGARSTHWIPFSKTTPERPRLIHTEEVSGGRRGVITKTCLNLIHLRQLIGRPAHARSDRHIPCL